MKKRSAIQIELTAEQAKQAQQTEAQQVCTQDLTPEVLEERIAPAVNLNSSRSN